MFKYLAYRHGGYTKGQRLLDESARLSVRNALLQSDVEFFETIQSYDQDARTLSAPLYADLDGEGCEDLVVELYDSILDDFGIKADIYFSGSKGFHLIVPVVINHSQPHLIAKEFFNDYCFIGEKNGVELFNPFLDQRVYTNRRLWRCEGSKHYKTGLYKKRVPIELVRDSIELVREYCRVPDVSFQAMNEHTDGAINLHIAEIIKRVDIVEAQKAIYIGPAHTSKNIPQCIASAIATMPLDGEWNLTITLIARFLNSNNFSMEESLSMMMVYDFWRNDSRHVEAVFKSVFRGVSHFGCRGQELLKRQCDVFCPYNKDAI